jgi:deoxyribodipyrimidine photo-lyase
LSSVPALRVRAANAKEIDPDGDYVLYWMIANRRTRHNFALDHAIARAKQLAKPLLVLEPLRIDYDWACDRFHCFVIDGMADNAKRFAEHGVVHYPYVEPKKGAGKGLVQALAERACLVVTDYYPAFFLPRAVTAAAAASRVLVEQVDANGILPIFAMHRIFTTARSFRIASQKILAEHLAERPKSDPLSRFAPPELAEVPRAIREKWPAADAAILGHGAPLDALAIDHSILPVEYRGGEVAARRELDRFIRESLPRYAEERDDPDADVASGLSPWLHFGHLSAHETLARVLAADDWTLGDLEKKPRGDREGFWGASANADAFLEQLVTWREIGFNQCAYNDDYDRYSSLPDWAKATLGKHAGDVREKIYSIDELAAAKTYDDVWNAAQRQLVAEGRIHNYLRMIWGKRVIEWSESPEKAVENLIELNNRYAVDGRDPNSYSGIFWTFGRYDRPWAPERKYFGTIRFMSSARTKTKLKMKRWLARWS